MSAAADLVSGGVRLEVSRHGAGAPLVCTHGLGSSAATWEPLLPHLPSGWAATCWDLRGHGRSGRPENPGAYSRDSALADLTAVVESAAGDAAPVLVGHSLGGYLSLALAISRPDLVRGLVLVAAGPGFRDPQRRAAWNRMLTEHASRLGVSKAVSGLCAQPDASVLGGLGAVQVPVVAVVGGRDRRFLAAVEVFRRRLGAEVHVVAGAGHHPHESHPTDVAAAIGRLLDRVEPDGRPPSRPRHHERTTVR